jgi:hypothetical protein
MSTLDKTVQIQLDNIQKKTGKSLVKLSAIAKSSGLTKHGELRDMFKEKLGLGHGDANALAHAIFESDGTRAAEGKKTIAPRQESNTTSFSRAKKLKTSRKLDCFLIVKVHLFSAHHLRCFA